MIHFLTGGTGYLGGNLARRLSRDGHAVRALARKGSRVSGIERLPGVTIVEGDLAAPEGFSSALRGCDGLFHVGAVVKEWVEDWSIFDRVNVDAPPRLFRLARDAGVKKIVYTSSFFAIGPSDRGQGGVVDETTTHEDGHWHNEYERTKALALPRVLETARAGAPVVTVCPGMIYGPGEVTEGNFVVNLLVDVARGKLPGLPGDGSKMWSYVHVDDVVQGHLLAMEKGRPGEVYILGGDNVALRDLFLEFERLTGVRAPRRKLPFFLLKAVGAIEQALAVLGRRPNLTIGKVAINEHHWAYSSAKAERELGFAHRPFAEGLAQLAAWMREKGLVDAAAR